MVTDYLNIFIGVFWISKIFFLTAIITFFISALDDLIFDAYFLVKRWTLKTTIPQRLTISRLCNKEEKFFALMIPAWQENEVIYQAVANFVNTINYQNYHIFVGVYPNDDRTMAEVDRLCAYSSKVHKVVVDKPGPTCKAHCLNVIVDGIIEFEKKYNINFIAFTLQDAEDVIHPYVMKLYNYFIDDFDLIQIPVYSLPRKWSDITGGHYMDEFAEIQNKEQFVRQHFAGIVVGAGVGTAYSKRALEKIKEKYHNYFNEKILTEDYELSVRMFNLKIKPIFVNAYLHDVANSAQINRTIATQEFFPNKFYAAVRQKTRWIIGISLQMWKLYGWHKNWRLNYLFWRDRKMLFFSHGIFLGYFSVLIFCLSSLYEYLDPNGYHFSPIISETSILWYIIYCNVLMMVSRLLQRSFYTYRCYGVKSLPMILPHYILGAVINYFATVRAIYIYLSHQFSGKVIGWDKTRHHFPIGDELRKSSF